MDKLDEVRFLETYSGHLNYSKSRYNHFGLNPDILAINFPINRPLPPKLEVLKIHKVIAGDSIYDIIDMILRSKVDIVPLLRKLILVLQWLDEAMTKELQEAAAAEEDRAHWTRSGEFYIAQVASKGTKDPHDKLRALCQEMGVELMLLWEDSYRKEVLREGAGPAV